jgi:hypothetical protein
MKLLVLAMLTLTTPARAEEAVPTDATPVVAEVPAGPVAAADVVLEDMLFVQRAVFVFADSPNDPNFVRQMELLARDRGELALRDAIVVIDTDPDARTEVRQKFRPRGFSLVLMDKDGRAMTRKPLPWELREVLAAFDKSPIRRQEVLERTPAGR